MTTEKRTVAEYLGSVNGFEEIAIEEVAKMPLEQILEENRDGLFTRVIVAIARVRETPTLTMGRAMNAVMGLSRKEVGAEKDKYVEAKEPAPAFEDLPMSDQGKDSPDPESEPTS